MQQYYLIGYMGSGKSTLGKELSKRLGMPFLDLDSHIEAKENTSIFDLFQTKGELYFRNQEHNHLKELLLNTAPRVVALGGGTPCYHGNVDLLLKAPQCEVVYLNGSVSFLSKRLFKEIAQRPIISHIKTEEELQEFVGKHLFEGLPFYQKAAKQIAIDNKSIEALIEELLN